MNSFILLENVSYCFLWPNDAAETQSEAIQSVIQKSEWNQVGTHFKQ